jgi:hypothetical protein
MASEAGTVALAESLAAALLAHHESGGAPKAFDRVARALARAGVAAGQSVEDVAAAAVRLKRLVQETWEEDTKAACKYRKIYHRAWLRGLVVGAVDAGMGGDALAEAIGRETVPVAYEEAVPLPTYAYSIGYGFGQAWATISRREADRQAWLAALKRGIDAAETAMRDSAAYHGVELDPDLAPPDDRAVDNVEAGFHLGSLTGFFSK